MAIVHLACASGAASLARDVRAAAWLVTGISAVGPARGYMSRGVEHTRRMSSAPVLRRGLCGLEIAGTANGKQSDGRHRVSKMMIVRNIGKEETKTAPLSA